MLVATFAVAFLLQAIALLWFGPLGSPRRARVAQPSRLDRRRRRAEDHARRDRRRDHLLLLLTALLERTTIGLHMRAAAIDFQTARLLGVRANRVIGAAVLLSGLLAATVAVLLTVQHPLVTPGFAFNETILVLVGVVLGGMSRLISATLGGFAIGFASGVLGGALPTDQSQYLPSVLFGLVILVLLIRPAGFSRVAAPWSACESPSSAFGDPSGARRANRRSGADRLPVRALDGDLLHQRARRASVVVALYIFVGNSGVLSFGHISFVAVGAWTAGVLSVPVEEKPATMPNLFRFLADTTVGNSRRCSSRRSSAARSPSRRGAADAALRARRRHRDVRSPGDHATTCCATTTRSGRGRTPSRQCRRQRISPRRRSAR